MSGKEVVIVLSKEVLQLLGISRPTLTKYVKTGVIRITELPNKRYDYNSDDGATRFIVKSYDIKIA